MTETLTYSTTLTIMHCGVCEIRFAIPTSLYERLLAGQETWFHCPKGDRLHFIETELDRERKKHRQTEAHLANARRRTEMAESRALAAQDQAAAAERRRRAAQGQLTKIRNRVRAGVCPVPGCKRTGLGEDVRAHIEAKHPTWHTEHPDATTHTAERPTS